jgi:hypothetical protein
MGEPGKFAAGKLDDQTRQEQRQPMNDNEHEAIETAFMAAVNGLYRTLFESLVTHPDEPDKATKRFRKGLGAARKAKELALQNLDVE